MAIDCFDKVRLPGLKEKFQSQLKDEMTDKERKELGKKLALDYHKELHDELNKFKKSIGLKQDEYVPEDHSQKIAAINAAHEKQIEAVKEENKPIPEEVKPEETTTNAPPVSEEPPPPTTTPEEPVANEDTGGTTGVKKSKSNDVRAANGLPKVEFPKMTTDVKALTDAKERVDSGAVNPSEMADRILKGKSGYHNEDEVMDMQYYSHQLERKNQELEKEYQAAKTPEEKAEVLGRKLQLSDLRDAQTEAALKAGNQWGRIGNRMSPVINDAGQIFREDVATINNIYDGHLPGKIKVEMDAIKKERDEAIAARVKLEEEIKKNAAENKFKEIKKESKKGKKSASNKIDSLFDELKKAKEEHEQWLKDNGIQKSGIGGFVLTPKMVKIVGKIAAAYAEKGYEKLSELVDKVYEDIKAVLPSIDKKDIHDALALHESDKQEATRLAAEAKVAADEARAESKRVEREHKENQIKTAKLEKQKKAAELKKEFAEKREVDSAYDKNKSEKEKAELKKAADVARAESKRIEDEYNEEKEIENKLKTAIDKSANKASKKGTEDQQFIDTIAEITKKHSDAKNIGELVDRVYSDAKKIYTGTDKDAVRKAIAYNEAERLNNKSDSMEDRMGNIHAEMPKLKLNFRTNTEWVKANQRVANAEFKIRDLKRKAFESQKNFYQKSLMWSGRLVRISTLSGFNVLYKLAAAATIGAAGKRIPEQMIGGIWSQIFKGIAQKAPIEGFYNAKSEAKFYKEFFNPKKFVHNSWEILKTGESDLSKKFGGGKYDHVKGLYLPTDLHQIIKDPVKRAAFESSMNNIMVWSEKNGVDINDELVINAMETAAYKRANYEIFQEQNWLSKRFTEWKNKMEKSGNVGATGKFLTDFMIPVSTVPTNIVRRLVTTSPLGLIRGGVKVIEAYRKGIENLSTEEADAVMKQLKQGTLGTALWLIGWFGYTHFGGLYSKYDPNKKRKAGEYASDEMEVGGTMLPKPIQHAIPLEIIQWAATARRIYENSREKGESTFNSIYHAGMGSVGALAEQIPVVETGAEVMGAFNNPYEAEKLKSDIQGRFIPRGLKETGIIPTAKPNQPQGKKAKKPLKHKRGGN